MNTSEQSPMYIRARSLIVHLLTSHIIRLVLFCSLPLCWDVHAKIVTQPNFHLASRLLSIYITISLKIALLLYAWKHTLGVGKKANLKLKAYITICFFCSFFLYCKILSSILHYDTVKLNFSYYYFSAAHSYYDFK